MTTLTEKIGELEVSSEAWGLLRKEASQTSIGTRAVFSCYVLIGKNNYGDILLGHFPPHRTYQEALTLAQNFLEKENEPYSRKIELPEFKFEMIPGPVAGREKLRQTYYDISCPRDGCVTITLQKVRSLLEQNNLSVLYR